MDDREGLTPQSLLVLLMFLTGQCLCVDYECSSTPTMPAQVSQPNLLIGIGAQKSGTTFLHHALSMHPSIVPAQRKELQAFGSPSFQPSQDFRDTYLKNWEDWLVKKKNPEGAILMEFTPSYLVNPEVPCQIKQSFPEAKFVVILREPASRTLSAVDMKRRHCSRRDPRDGDKWPFCCEELFQPMVPKLKNATLELENLKKECADSKSFDPWWKCPRKKIAPLDKGLYSAQLALWFRIFDPSQFLILNTQDLFVDPRREVGRVLQFAGVTFNRNAVDLTGFRDNVANAVFVEPGLPEMKQQLRLTFEESNHDLYRLLSHHGHAFTPFADDEIKFGHEEYSLEQGAALCCHGVNYDQLDTLSNPSTDTEFCRKQPHVVLGRTGLHSSMKVVLLGILVALFTWITYKCCTISKRVHRKAKFVRLKC